MNSDLPMMRHARKRGEGFRVSMKRNGQWFVAYSWKSYEDCERKITADVERLEAAA